MSNPNTINPDQLPVVTDPPGDMRAVVHAPGGSLEALPFQRLLSKLIATDLVFADKATLDADLAHDADVVALVHNDPIALQNGWYRKSGASGAGAWEQFDELARSSRMAAEAAVEEAESQAVAAQAAQASTQAALDQILLFEQSAAVFGTKATALAASTVFADYQIILILEDETQNGRKTYYQAYKGLLLFFRFLNQPRDILLSLAGLGTSGITVGLIGLAEITGYTGDVDRMRRAQNGFVRCGANEERLCFDNVGGFTGQYLQAGDTYLSAPWDDPSAPNGSGDPARVSNDSGDRASYAGEHSEADIFGGTGGGVVLKSQTTNQFHTASNISASVVAGDVIRYQAIVAIDGASEAGRVDIRGAGTNAFGFTFDHDASGVITGFTENWATYRAGFHDMGTINGKRWWYIWADREMTGSGAVQPGIGFGNIAAQSGKSYHVCELMLQKNPASAPAAIPVCKANATFAADRPLTSLSNAGFALHGAGLARSQIVNGAFEPPAVPIGTPYDPLVTAIEVFSGVESADRAGIMPNRNAALYARPWKAPADFSIFYGPGFFPRDWIMANDAASACTNATIASVFQSRRDLLPILGPIATSRTFIPGQFNVEGILLGVGDKRTKYSEQSHVLAGSGSTFYLGASSISLAGSLLMGGTLHSSRADHLVQEDDTPDRQVYIGEVTLNTAGGSIDLSGVRTHNLARLAVEGFQISSPISLNTDGLCAMQFYMDALFLARGTIDYSPTRMLTALDTAHKDMFFCQSERPVQISEDGGQSWADLSPAFDPATMPHGFLAEHIGSYDFDTDTFTSDPDSSKSLRVRYWELDAISSPQITKPGFQWRASQMDKGTHSRYPTTGDVFRITNGDQIIDVTYQGGEWRSGGYTRYTGLQADNPSPAGGGISNDHIQVDRGNVVMTQGVVVSRCVFLGPKGSLFITGMPSLTGSALHDWIVQDCVMMSEGTNAVRWDQSSANPANMTIPSALIIEARSDITFSDGSGHTLSLGADGANNVMTFGDNVTVITSAGGGALTTPQNGGSYVNASAIRTVAAGQRSNYDQFTAPDPKVAQYLDPVNYDPVQGRALLPAPDTLFTFNLTAFADSDAGFDVRAVITEAQGDHALWDPVIAEVKKHFHRAPDHRAAIAASTPVDTVVFSGLTDTAFHSRMSGDPDGFFKRDGDQMKVAKPLTGLDQIFWMVGDGGEVTRVDVA